PRPGCVIAPGQSHGCQLTMTPPGFHSCPAWHCSGYGHQSGRPCRVEHTFDERAKMLGEVGSLGAKLGANRAVLPWTAANARTTFGLVKATQPDSQTPRQTGWKCFASRGVVGSSPTSSTH